MNIYVTTGFRTGSCVDNRKGDKSNTKIRSGSGMGQGERERERGETQPSGFVSSFLLGNNFWALIHLQASGTNCAHGDLFLGMEYQSDHISVSASSTLPSSHIKPNP